MSKGQLIMDGKKSYDDFNFNITNLEIGAPAPILNFETVPYHQGIYDFTKAGDTQFSSRIIKFEFELDEYNASSEKLNYIYFKFINWLYSRQEMIQFSISYIDGTYEGRVTDISDFTLFQDTQKITVTFTCQPFRTMCNEASGLWDDLDFDSSYIQDYNFKINSRQYKKINLYCCNTATTFVNVKVYGTVTIKANNNSFELKAGTYKNNIILKNGMNTIYLRGFGRVEFYWDRKVI